MAVFEEKKTYRLSLDDTVPLTCSIVSSKNMKDHTEYDVRVQRGPVPENSWIVTKRYSDFVSLDTSLKIAGIELPLPPKKVFGNMEREFIAERQNGLQNYLQVLLSHPYLANDLIVKRFLDLTNYETNLQEVALQNISMFFRSEPKWEVVEPAPDIGTRIRKQYFLIKDKAQPKEKFILSWCNFGPDKFLQDKDLVNIMKLFCTFQHPHIYPVSFAMANETGGIAIRQIQSQGTMRDIICKARPKMHVLKKYANPKVCATCQLPAIKIMGRQILETLKFLHEKGMPYGHLHAGNIVVEENRVKLLDVENWLLGLPSYYRCYFTQLKKVNTMEDIDVYSFGHLLYEMAMGRPLNCATCDHFPANCAPDLRAVLESILTTEASKNGLPTVSDLLQHQFFRDVVLPPSEKPQLKIPSKLKEALKEAKLAVEKRLKEEKKVIKQFKRLSKAQAFHMSEEEKKKRRRSKKKQLSEDDSVTKNGVVPTTPAFPAVESDVPATPTSQPAVQTPPPAPPVSPPPPPPPTQQKTPAQVANGTSSPARGALLNSITSFNKGKGLKKAQTVDKSAPRI